MPNLGYFLTWEEIARLFFAALSSIFIRQNSRTRMVMCQNEELARTTRLGLSLRAGILFYGFVGIYMRLRRNQP